MLASFVRLSGAESSFADFGTGCGVIGLAVLLRALQLGESGGEAGCWTTPDKGPVFTAGAGLDAATGLCFGSRQLSGKLSPQPPLRLSSRPVCNALAGLRELGQLRREQERTLRLRGTGYEVSPELCAAARKNAESLGLAAYFNIVEHDLALPDAALALNSEIITGPRLNKESGVTSRQKNAGFDFIVANPPYRLLSEGRAPASPLRRMALFEEKGSMSLFAASASKMLREGGSFYCVYPVKREAYLTELLSGFALYPRRLLRVYGQAGKQAPFFLLEACKGVRGELAELPGLVLYNGASLTREALEFCSFLACNSSRG